MPRPVRHTRSVRRISRYLAVFVAAAAVFVGAVVPIEAVSATASASVSAPQARLSSDPAQTGIAKATLDGFSAGNIISDAVFTNKSTMTEAQIQSFFNGKVPKCVVGKDENGKPYVCLKDYRISSVNRPADSYCSGYKGAPNETAARIIYKVAQACNINPQVLIVMLQKEQGLVTHVWPSAWRYDSALGQGCPDTAPCDPNFVGFFHQIYGAARQMQIYMEGKWFTWYAPGKTWGIQWHPNASCGRGNVYVANKATSALYYYTPYQPNAAAMRAGYGEGDACSSYGNRNFYNYFTDWFGSTQPKPQEPKPSIDSMDRSTLAVALGSDGKLWAYAFGKGRWGDKVQLASGLTNVSKVVGVGDLNGDGHRDFVAFSKSGQVSALYGDGTTTYSQRTNLVSVGKDAKLVTSAGDFNGDGIPDLFTTNAAGDLFLWPGTENGRFGSAVKVGRGWGAMTSISGGADMSGDGIPDVVARDTAGRLWLYLGNGSGGWKSAIQVGRGWGSFIDVVNIGDFTGDGKGDVIGVNSAGATILYRGVGGGGLGSSSTVGTGWKNMVISAGGPAATSPRAFTAGAGNIDGKGGRDVLAVSADGQLLFYGGNGAGGWASTRVLNAGSGWKRGDRMYPLGDFNGDGIRDVARIDTAGNFRVLTGRADGGFNQSVVVGKGWKSLSIIAAGIDYDGDRNPDVIARTSAGALLLYRGDGKGGWIGSGTQIGQKWGAIDSGFYAGDFDGDGRGDIIARAKDGTLWLYPTTGSGGWGTARQIGSGWGSMTAMFSPGDFDGDGRSDVLGRAADGRLILYRGDGKGGWLSSVAIGRGWQNIALLG